MRVYSDAVTNAIFMWKKDGDKLATVKTELKGESRFIQTIFSIVRQAH